MHRKSAATNGTMETIAQLAEALRAHRLSPVELVERCLAHIAATDGTLRAWQTVAEKQALAEARTLGRMLRDGVDLGPLHGIPVGVKDNVCTAGMTTTGGSRLYAEFVPDEDADVIQSLRRAGAIVLGKTATAELALADPTPTRNPWNTEHTPGGSSSGSAAAVAAGHVPFAVATQTGGSLSRPAAYCGLVALKPTQGVLSTQGVFPVSPTMDHVGFMTRTAKDQAIVLEAVLGAKLDTTIETVPDTTPGAGFRSGLRTKPSGSGEAARSLSDRTTFAGVTIGRPDRYFFAELDRQQRDAYDEALRIFEGEWAMVVADVKLPPAFDEAAAVHTTIMEKEAADQYGAAFRRNEHLVGPYLRTRLLRGLAIDKATYEKALARRRELIDEMGVMFGSGTHFGGGIDLLATPTTPGAAPSGIQSTGPSHFNSPFTMTGFPTIVFPVGYTLGLGLPLSVQLVAAPGGERLLLNVASAYERIAAWTGRRSPLSPS